MNGNSIPFVLRWGLSREISGFGDMVSHFVRCDCSGDSLKRTACFTGGNGHPNQLWCSNPSSILCCWLRLSGTSLTFSADKQKHQERKKQGKDYRRQ